MRETPFPWISDQKGLVLAVRVTPKAAREGIEGVGIDGEGRSYLKIKVSAPPEDGKANAAVERLLARTWKLAKSGVTVISGATRREKRILLAGESLSLEKTLRDWLHREYSSS